MDFCCTHGPPLIQILEKNSQGLPSLITCGICGWKARVRSRVTWYCPTCKGRHACFNQANGWRMYGCPESSPERPLSQKIFDVKEMGEPQFEIVEVTLSEEPASK